MCTKCVLNCELCTCTRSETHVACLVSDCSETMRLDSGLVIELWNKGMLWDKLIGTHWLPLISVKHSNQVRYSTLVQQLNIDVHHE